MDMIISAMRRRKKGQCLLLLLITLLGCVVYFTLYYHSSDHAPHTTNTEIEGLNVIQTTKTPKNISRKCMPYRKRLRTYCHTSLLEPHTTQFSQEGKLSHSHPDLLSVDLVHVHVVVRHGDRTPAFQDPEIGYPKVNYRCGVSGVVHRSDSWGAHKPNLWDGLRDFPPLAPTGPGVRNGGLKLHPGSVDQECGIGELTGRGYLQEHNLGTLLQMSYGTLFPGMDLSNDIQVQSTDFSRTIRSAGAFLLGFIPNVPKIREMITIRVQPGSLNQAPPTGIPITYKPCPTLLKLRELERKTRGYYKSEAEFRWLHDKVVDTFNLTRRQRSIPWTEVFDKFMTRGCHALNAHSILPCTKSGTCIDCQLGKTMFDYADWSMFNKYPPNSSLIAVAPFIKHSLLDPMETIISRGGDSSSLKYRVMLTFTHDSMINQLMKTIGVPVEQWVPYASRLSIELWRTRDSMDHQGYLLRLLFNGKIITDQLSIVNDGNELVDFTKFKKNVLPIDTLTYSKLCNIE